MVAAAKPRRVTREKMTAGKNSPFGGVWRWPERWNRRIDGVDQEHILPTSPLSFTEIADDQPSRGLTHLAKLSPCQHAFF
jgi:hypothetical protein